MSKNTIPLPLGFLASGIHAGLKSKGKLDMGFLYSSKPAVWAGVVTKNAVKSAPARRTETLLQGRKPLRAVVVNTKYANDLTGLQGYKDVLDTAVWAARLLKIPAHEVLAQSVEDMSYPQSVPPCPNRNSTGHRAEPNQGGTVAASDQARHPPRDFIPV